MNKEHQNQIPPLGETYDQEEHLSIRIFGYFSHLYGERGQSLRDLYQYLRWVDDVVDESKLTRQQKQEFIARQISFLTNKDINLEGRYEQEQKIHPVLWSDTGTIPTQLVRDNIKIAIENMQIDLELSLLNSLCEEKFREYHINTLLPTFEIIALCLNGKPAKPGSKFAECLYGANLIATLADLAEDLGNGKNALPLNELLTPERFNEMKRYAFGILADNFFSIWDTDMPLKQRLGFYLFFAAALHFYKRKVQYPKFKQRSILEA